jgi:DNA polymerase III epsilon subunit-like protein
MRKGNPDPPVDVVITQSGKKFDVKKLNTRFIYYGFPPYRPFHHIDTLEAANAAFDASSHSLAYMTKFLGLARKMETNYELWKRCTIGDMSALREMYSYGLNDTFILEEYYVDIRAWIPKHPNFSAYTNRYVEVSKGEHSCPICRTPIAETLFRDKYRTPLGYKYHSTRCGNCGSIVRMSERMPNQSIPVQRAG